MRFQEEDETVTFYTGPPPQPVTLHRGPLGPPWELPMNNFYSSPKQGIYTLHNLTILLLDLKRRCLKFAWFGPFWGPPLGPHGGHTYYLNNFESPTPKDDFYPVWLKSNHAF